MLKKDLKSVALNVFIIFMCSVLLSLVGLIFTG